MIFIFFISLVSVKEKEQRISASSVVPVMSLVVKCRARWCSSALGLMCAFVGQMVVGGPVQAGERHPAHRDNPRCAGEVTKRLSL